MHICTPEEKKNKVRLYHLAAFVETKNENIRVKKKRIKSEEKQTDEKNRIK